VDARMPMEALMGKGPVIRAWLELRHAVADRSRLDRFSAVGDPSHPQVDGMLNSEWS